MKKVAIINTVFKYGSTGDLAKQLYEYGKGKGYEAWVLYGRGKKELDNHVVRVDLVIEVYLHKILGLLTGYRGFFSNHATNKVIKILRDKKIDKVILLNIHGYYLNEFKLLNYLKRQGIKTVYVTPDEYAGMGRCYYSLSCEKYKTECKECSRAKGLTESLFFDRSNEFFCRKKEIYENFDSLIFAGPEANLAKFRKSALIKDKPMKRVSWGIDLKTYRYYINERVFNRYKIPKNKVIILTAANYSNSRKGVKQYFFELARRFQNTNYHFINVGYDGDLKQSEIPNNMTLIEYVDDQRLLAQIYSAADMYLLASTADTMPMSCLISFACGTPVCCFYTSGLKYLAPREHIAIRYSDEVSIDSLERIINSTEKKDDHVIAACRELAEKEYSVQAFNRKIYEALERI